MGFLDRLLGREDDSQYRRPTQPQRTPERSEDERAVERYRYLLRTAPPETIEQVHAEAFAKLTPEQRALLYEELKRGSEQPAGDDPASLARAATRSEMREPGTMERTFAGTGARGGPGFGSMLGASLLGTIAGYVVASALVSAFLPDPGYGEAGGEADAAADGGDPGADAGWGEGGDAGGGGGDFGGGDFGGGDFGGFDV